MMSPAALDFTTQRALAPGSDPERAYGVQVNALDVPALFDLYERTGFLYPAKASRLVPYMYRVRENWRRLLRAGDSLLYVLTSGDDREGRASVAVWRTTSEGWTWQHLVCENNPLRSRAVMLGGLVRCMQRGNEASHQNWFRPENRFPARVFGSMVPTLGESLSSVHSHMYFELPRQPHTNYADGTVRLVPYNPLHRDALRSLAVLTRGSVYVAAEELERDVELLTVDHLYRTLGLRRTRHVWLAYRPGGDEAIGAAIAYRGPLGLNFSFLENRCDLLLRPGLPQACAASTTATLLEAAAAAYDDFELEDIPVVADEAAVPALTAMGARFLRNYCAGIWLKAGQPALYQHVDRFYSGLMNREKRRIARSNSTSIPGAQEN